MGKLDQTTGKEIPRPSRNGANLDPGLTSIIILCHNQLEYTAQCVDTILRHTPESFELIFIDNGSTDGTLDYLNSLAANHDNINIIANEKNLGFAAAVNQGIKAARGDYILLLNNDVLVTPGWLKRMLECMNRDERVGLVGPVSNFVAGIQRIIDPEYNVAKLDEYAQAHSFRYSGLAQRTARIIGFCMLIRREVIDRIGGFDITFGTGNFEDDDFCLRAGIAGFQIIIARDVFIHHYGSATFKGMGIDYGNLMRENAWIFRKKWDIEMGPNGYNPLPVLMRPFDPMKHYFPLVSEWTSQSLLQESVRLFSLSRIEESYVTVVRALDLEPTNRNAWHNMALIAMSQGDFEGALEWWGKFSETEMDAERLNLTGICKFQLGRQNEALEYFKRALQLDPQCPGVRENLDIAMKSANGLNGATTGG
ncbi:MAG: glycosyltransferase [Firmicutes bacterium]|nr:glycosyltransferase [Bacillota bacterium]